jgi:streptomycin 6-kinase
VAEPVYRIPEKFARQAADHYGADGVAWVGRLPAILAECARQWSLAIDPPFETLSWHFVAPATRADGMPAVLKVGPAGREPKMEMEALHLFDGCGVVRLLAFDREQHAMLLERLEPGAQLGRRSAFDGGSEDEEVTGIAAGVMRQLWRQVPPEHTFPSVADWVAEWAEAMGELRARCGGVPGPYPAALIDTAERLVAALLGSMPEAMVLHGDLHPWNILSAQRQPWLAIDPKGVVGDPAFETGPLLCSGPQEGQQTARVLARRADQLAGELGFDRARILAWGVVQAVLLAWWVGGDTSGGAQMIARGETLAELAA